MQVSIGQKCGQAQRSRSWCLWDVRTDGAASETYENESMFCICQVCRQCCALGYDFIRGTHTCAHPLEWRELHHCSPPLYYRCMLMP